MYASKYWGSVGSPLGGLRLFLKLLVARQPFWRYLIGRKYLKLLENIKGGRGKGRNICNVLNTLLDK